MLALVCGEQSSTNTITAWYSLSRRHWRWYCRLCNEEHGTGAIESDYDGPVLTAVYNHIDLAHPGTNVEIEVKNADGDINDGD